MMNDEILVELIKCTGNILDGKFLGELGKAEDMDKS